MNIETHYKIDEIKQYFNDSLEDYDKETLDKLIRDNELHHEIFSTDYYIIGRHKAVEWLSDRVFEVINIIKEYENMHFGKVITDFSEPERVVNMYVYIAGENIIYNYINSLEVKSA
tara:strand:+ start:1249 stop:1596 length:348 start_codon:yes stop_codon:yes gene_type:complete